MTQLMYRQGDLLFIATSNDCKGYKKNDLVILESAITGHDHRITAGEVFINNPDWSDRANFYINVPDGAEVVHPEHKSIPLQKGVYRVIRQREVNGYVQD